MLIRAEQKNRGRESRADAVSEMESMIKRGIQGVAVNSLLLKRRERNLLRYHTNLNSYTTPNKQRFNATDDVLVRRVTRIVAAKNVRLAE